MADINILTPLSDATRRKDQIKLLQLVCECTDGDYLRAMVTIRPAEVPKIIDAKRAGIFDYGQLLLETSGGTSWPAAPMVLAGIEKARAGELTIDSEEWVEIMKSFGSLDGARVQSGTKIKSEAHLLHMVINFDVKDDGTRKTKRFSAKKTAAKKTAAKVAAPVPDPTPDPVETAPAEPAAETPAPKKRRTRKKAEPTAPPESSTDVSDDLMDQLAGAFQALDERILGKLAAIEAKVDNNPLREEVASLRDESSQALAAVFRAVQLVAKVAITCYHRQEEIALDPLGDATELDKADMEFLGELIGFDPDETGEQAEVVTTTASEPDSSADEAPPGDSVDEPPETSGSDDDVVTIVLSPDHGTISDDAFSELISKADDIEIHDVSMLSDFSINKIRSLAMRVGVPSAKSLNHRKLLIEKIRGALSTE